MKKIILFLSVLMLFSSCFSIKKYNAQIEKKHSINELKEDVDYAYNRLQRLQPNLYLYISKEQLDLKFDSLKKSIKNTMGGQDLYKKLAPVIASIRQGHTSTSPPFKLQTKKEKKKKGKRKNPFNPLRFRKLNRSIILTRNFGKDSTIIEGSELLKIENETVENLLQSFNQVITGDGYNKTFAPEITRRYIGSLYIKTHGFKDSLQLTLKDKERIYKKYIYTYPKKRKNKKTAVKKELSKIEKKIAKKEKKARIARNKKYGYNKLTKEDTRNLTFLKTDSTATIAYLKIRRFMNGTYKDFYKETFEKIDSAKVENLIIDLRYNGGGRLSEIGNLYSYLTDKEHLFIADAKMTRRSSWMYPMFHNNSTGQKVLFTTLYPIMRVFQAIKVKKVNGISYFKFNSGKKNKPKEKNYKGAIYVLINGASFSASSILSNNLQANKRAFFVGEETGGAYNSTVAGRMAVVELPNSKAKVIIGLMNLETLHKQTPKGYGVKPDKLIKVTTLNRDEQLDWIIDKIKSEKKEQ